MPKVSNGVHPNESVAGAVIGVFRRQCSWISLLVLLVSLGLTAGGWRIVQQIGQDAAHIQFDARRGDVVQQIQQRMHTYEYVLRGGAALFASSDRVDRKMWHDYVASLKIDQHISGIQGLGFARYIASGEKRSHIATVRAEGFPGYTITPLGERSEYTPIVFLEPFSGRNLRAFGFDMLSGQVRREAMERARDSGEIAVSGKVRLVQETEDGIQSGFLMYMPVYRNGMPHGTVAERRAALAGYVYSPFRMNDLMDGIVGRSIPDLDIHIYDGEGTLPAALIYESMRADRSNHKKSPAFFGQTMISVGGHPWTVHVESLPSFDAEAAKKSPVIVLVMGSLISFLLFFFVRGQERSRRYAVTLAEEMTDAFRESESRLRAILDNSPYMAWLKDDQGRYVKINKAYLDYIRVDGADEVVGKTDFDLWPSDLAEKYRMDDEEVMAQRQHKHVEEPSLDGNQIHWVETFKTPVVDVHGNVLGTTGFSHDITERKQKEAEIVRLSSTYRLLSHVNEAIVRSENRDALFATICRAASESGLFRMAWIGMLDTQASSIVPVAHAGVEEGYLQRLHIRLDDEHAAQGPTATALRNGVHVVCQDIEIDPKLLPWRDEALKRGFRSSGAFPIREAGVVVGTMSVYAAETYFFTRDLVQLMLELSADVSFALDVFAEKKRREQAEAELKQFNLELERRVHERTHQLEVANKELEAFSYSVSHDLRAPLRSIDGFSQILMKKYQGQLDETGNDYLQRVRRASQRMGLLIDDLLQLSRVSRSALKRERVDISAIAAHVVDDLRKSMPNRQVRFELQQGLFAYADPGLLHVVLDNLLGNAHKFTGKKADATVEFGMCDYDGESAYFVRDNGDGFNMDYAHKLFGAFQRLHAVNEFEGTGIGLATVRRIIQRHHGRIWAEGKEGAGASFYFTLPQRLRTTEGRE